MSAPGNRRPPRRFAIALATVPLVAVGLTDAAIALHHARPSSPQTPAAVHHPKPASSASAEAERAAIAARTRGIRDLLARRSDAVLHHNLSEWMSTVDPVRHRFRATQRREFTNLRQVPFAAWSYTFAPSPGQAPSVLAGRYRVPAWAPTQFSLHYRLRGFDPAPTDLAQYPTFTRRGGGWYLASLSDFAGSGLTSSVDLWDFGPVVVVRTPRVLVLGHPAAVATMQELAGEVNADIPRVTAVWGSGWPQRAVVLVPSTQRELGLVVGDGGDLDHIAAVTTAEVHTGPGKPHPVGDRIGINPANWPKLSLLGRRIVLTHELTHVATRTVTSAATPTWLAEGLADYVGYLGSGVPVTFVAQDLARTVRAGHVPRTVPPDAQFDGASKKLSDAYEGAWLACRLIAQDYGQDALVRLYRVVGRSHDRPAAAVAAGMQQVLHVSLPTFIARWRLYVRSELR